MSTRLRLLIFATLIMGVLILGGVAGFWVLHTPAGTRWSLEQINEAIADTKTGSAKRNVIVFD